MMIEIINCCCYNIGIKKISAAVPRILSVKNYNLPALRYRNSEKKSTVV
jgi:hypothetical protein